MTLYIAHNSLMDATTALGGGGSFTAGIKVAIQIEVPSSQCIRIAEFGWSQDVATATSTLLKLQTTDTGSTVSTAHTTTSVQPLIDRTDSARATSMTMGGTTHTGFGTGGLTSRTALRDIEVLYVPQVYVKQWPLGQWPIVGNVATENFLHLVVNTTATVNGYCYIIWDEA